MDYDEIRRIFGEEAPAKPKLTGADAINALLFASANFLRKHTFFPGQLICKKDGLANNSSGGDRGDTPCVFLRYDEEISRFLAASDPGNPHYAFAKDCLILWLHPEGSCVVSAANSEYYEPFPNPIDSN